MSNQVAVPGSAKPLPEYMKKLEGRVKDLAASATAGIKGGNFARISISGSKFHWVKEGKATLITDPRDPTLPLMKLNVVIIKTLPNLSKTFYEGEYEAGDANEPDCSSEDGIVPDKGVPKQQFNNCAQCPKNQWGSKITPQGKQAKACTDSKRMVILPASQDPASPNLMKLLEFEPAALSITPSSLKDWAKYVQDLTRDNRAVLGVVTSITFDPTASFPKLLFSFCRDLTEQELDKVLEREDSDAINMVLSPKANFTPALPAPTTPTEPVKPAEVNHQPAQGTMTLEGGSPPAQPAPEAPQAAPQQPAAPAVTPDPYKGLPAHVKAAVDAAGGLGSPGGEAVYQALIKQFIPGQEAPAEKKRGRGRPSKAAPQTPAGAPPAEAATAAPADVGFGGTAPAAPAATPQAAEKPQQDGGYSGAPAEATATGAPDLSAMLSKALG